MAVSTHVVQDHGGSPSDSVPVHVSLGVLVLRAVVTMMVLGGALTASLVVMSLHGSQMAASALECPVVVDASGEPVPVHRSSSRSDGGWCRYGSTNGGLGNELAGSPGAPNLLEPRGSFILAAAALAVTWAVALILLVLTWTVGWGVHRQTPEGSPVA